MSTTLLWGVDCVVTCRTRVERRIPHTAIPMAKASIATVKTTMATIHTAPTIPASLR
jgi:hypothetical protein